jgi:hypothetical protein
MTAFLKRNTLQSCSAILGALRGWGFALQPNIPVIRKVASYPSRAPNSNSQIPLFRLLVLVFAIKKRVEKDWKIWVSNPNFCPAIFREQRKIALGEQPNALLLVKDFYKKMIAKSGAFTREKLV